LAYNPNWLSPAIVLPSGNKVVLLAHPDLMERHFRSRNLSALGAYQGILRQESILLRPTAVFKGIKRPVHSEGVDNFIFVYVSSPECDYRYSKPHYKAVDSMLPPTQSVFVTFVSRAPALVRSLQSSLGCSMDDFQGVVLGWEWTLASQTDTALPDNFAKRYTRRVWRRS